MNTKALHELTDILHTRGQSVTAAESCTGGLLCAELTRLPGSSAWFKAGFVTYANSAKTQFLGVDTTTLTHCGAVSAETVREMAAGARAAAQADYALAISGIAGPDGGSADKPVGTVWFGLATTHTVLAQKQLFTGTRDEIRILAVDYVLSWLTTHLHASPSE